MRRYDHRLEQSLQSNGKSELVFFEGLSERIRRSSDQAKDAVTDQAVSCWENGQLATISGATLVVADIPVPFQALDSKGVRVLPEGLVCSAAQVSGAFSADEVETMPTFGIGSFYCISPYKKTPRLLEVGFGNDTFHASNDRKLQTTQVTAPDGSVLQAQGDLVEVNQGFRLQTQQSGGILRQSLLADELLLTLSLGPHSVIIQHKSGQVPLAFQRDKDGMPDELSNLPVRLDAHGSYWFQDGSEEKEVKPLLPLSFLEKKAD
ncbi:MAG: hypothetical protein U0931_11730 [Vulcanimicrobiota bacterium]